MGAWNISMNNKFAVVFTPGSFGHYVAYILDCYQKEKVLSAPFVAGGASHNRERNVKVFDYFAPYTRQDIDENRTAFETLIGCVWNENYFQYILHAYLSRTNDGQYNGCGVEYLEKNFYDFVQKHGSYPKHDAMKQLVQSINYFFGYDVNKENKTVPRYILRQFFWLQIFYRNNNRITKINNEIKNMQSIDLLNITDILDYDKLQSFMRKYFNYDLDFKDLHKEFIDKNISLYNFLEYKRVVDACKQNKFIDIKKLSVIGEAAVLYDLEKHYFDVPFFSMNDFPNNTKDLINYAKYFPKVMKQPNKLYHKFFRDFPPNVDL